MSVLSSDDRQRAKDAVRRIDWLRARLEDIVLASDDERAAQIRDEVQKAVEESTMQFLSEQGVELLAVGDQVAQKLTEAGYTTIGQLIGAPPQLFPQFEGDKSVHLSKRVLVALADAYALVPVRIDEAHKADSQTLLVRTLVQEEPLALSCAEKKQLTDTLEGLEPNRAALTQLPGFLGGLLMDAEKYQAFQSNLARVAETLPLIEERVTRLELAVRGVQEMDDATCWREYERSHDQIDKVLTVHVDRRSSSTMPCPTMPVLHRLASIEERAKQMRQPLNQMEIPSQTSLASNIERLAKTVRAEETSALLSQLDVEVLRTAGVAVDALKSAGIGTVDQLCFSGEVRLPSQLVSAAAREKTIQVTKRIYDAVYSITPCSLVPQTSKDCDLLAQTIYRYQKAPDADSSRFRAFAAEKKLSDACSRLRSTSGFHGHVFMRPELSERLCSQADDLEGELVAFEATVKTASLQYAALSPSTESLWDDFEQNRLMYERVLRNVGNVPKQLGTPRITASLARRVAELVGRFDEVVALVDGCDIPGVAEGTKAIKTIIEGMKASEASKRLHDIDVDVLAHGGVKVGYLRKAGYSNFESLSNRSVRSIARVPGINDRAAQTVRLAVDGAFRSAMEAASVRLDYENRDARQTELVVKLFERRLEAPLRTPLADLARAIEPRRVGVQKLGQSPGYLGNLVMLPVREHDLSRQADELASFLASIEPTYAALRDGLAELNAVTDDSAWEDFRENAATYYAEIEELGGGSGVAVGELPKTLVDKVASFKVDTSLMKSTLRSYQRFGVQYALAQKKTLIGDEMGLGKTVEAVAAMAHLAAGGEERFVVICPLSVLVNWAREIPHHANLTSVTIYGADRDKMFNYWRLVGGVAVTTYETVARLDWSRVGHVGLLVVDEAHYIKNPAAKRTRAVRDLAMPVAEYVIMLTGTPLENRVDEMNSLIGLLDRELVRTRLESEVMNPIAYRREIAPVYLRRKREDVLNELPKLIRKDDWCVMTDADKRDYLDTLRHRSFPSARRVGWRHNDMAHSAKAQRLLEICEEARENGSKVLVFSFFLDTLGKVAELVGDQCAGVLSGKVPAAKRQGIIDEFAKSERTVLVSQVTAGGVGLNIQAANVVVFCEPQIKPSMEEQAVSRSYRMGQVRTVVVHKLLMDKTVDERVEEILRSKQWQFDNYADRSQVGDESMGVINAQTIVEIIEAERKRYGITGGASGDVEVGELDPKWDDVAPVEALATQHREVRATSSSLSSEWTPISQRSEERPAKTTTNSTSNGARKAAPSRGKRKGTSRSFSFNVAGLNVMDMGDMWSSGIGSMVSVVRERNNRYDKNAVALYIGSVKAGYVPRETAKDVARLLDMGYSAEVTSVSAKEKPNRKRYKDEWGDYYYEEDWENTHTVATVRIRLTEPDEDDDSESVLQRFSSGHTSRTRFDNKPLTVYEAMQAKDRLPKSLKPYLRDTFVLLAQGTSRPQIAAKLGISRDDANSYAKLVYRFLHVRNMGELYAYARRLLKE